MRVLGFGLILCLSKSALLLLHTNELLETLSYPFLVSLFPSLLEMLSLH